jgi:hypothetical protein
MAQGNNPHDVFLSQKVSPAILSAMLGCYPENIYQMRQDGRLPPSPEASYFECIKYHLEYLKGKVNARRTSMGEAKLEQDIRNGKAKEVLQWLDVKEKKESLVEVHTLKDEFEAVFHTINSGLVNITRKFPDTQKDVDKMLSSWHGLGERICEIAHEEGMAFVDAQLGTELEIELEEPDDLEDGGSSNFGKWEKRE